MNGNALFCKWNFDAINLLSPNENVLELFSQYFGQLILQTFLGEFLSSVNPYYLYCLKSGQLFCHGWFGLFGFMAYQPL